MFPRPPFPSSPYLRRERVASQVTLPVFSRSATDPTSATEEEYTAYSIGIMKPRDKITEPFDLIEGTVQDALTGVAWGIFFPLVILVVLIVIGIAHKITGTLSGPVIELLGLVDKVNNKQLEGDLAARFPEHAAAVHSYFRLAESVQLRFALWVVSSVLPMGARLALLASPLMRMWRKWASKTTRDGLNELIPGDDARTAQLRALMSGLWLDSGSPPTRMSFWMQTAVFGGFQVLGAAYPTGGPQEMAMAMAEAVEARGGAVFVKTPVASIEVDGSGAAVGVRLADGDVVRAPLVVSGLGYRSTESLLPAAHRAGRKLQTDQSCGFVMANIALDGTADELGISSANLWLQPASEANDWDVFGGIDAFFESPLDVPVAHIPAGITFPSVKDRSHAGARQQPSHHSCQILVPACFEWFSALEEARTMQFVFSPLDTSSSPEEGEGEGKADGCVFHVASADAPAWL